MWFKTNHRLTRLWPYCMVLEPTSYVQSVVCMDNNHIQLQYQFTSEKKSGPFKDSSRSLQVGGFKHGFNFPFHKWDVILPIDELIFFQRGRYTTKQFDMKKKGFQLLGREQRVVWLRHRQVWLVSTRKPFAEVSGSLQLIMRIVMITI